MAFGILVFFFVPFLPQTMAVWLHSTLSHNSNVLYGNFTIDWNHRLAMKKIASLLAEDQFDCTFKCTGDPKCYSFNLAVNPDSSGLYLCELLATDKYRAAANDLLWTSAFHHYSPWSPCLQAPCKNRGNCTPEFEMNTYRCDCQPGFAGIHCERKGKACSEIKSHSSLATNGSYEIDPDGEGGYEPFTVFCDMTNKNGVGVTIVSHDSESRMLVDGYEAPGSYLRNVHYIGAGLTDVPQLGRLLDASSHCEQFIKYECINSLLLFSVPLGNPSGWWMSRSLTKMTYWGGATSADAYKCACGVTSPNTCADSFRGCNCDKNDNTWREDSGLLTEKSHLPVLQLKFGDTGSAIEKGYHTLGKLMCYGMD